jgi:hypothetical protein
VAEAAFSTIDVGTSCGRSDDAEGRIHGQELNGLEHQSRRRRVNEIQR